MANGKTLVPNSDRSAEELKKMGAKGGVASGATRRRKRATRELVRALLNLSPKLSRKQQGAIAKLGYDAEVEGAPTVEMVMQMAVVQQALQGDLASARFLYDYAHVPDIKAQLERERIKAAKEQATKPASMDIEDLTPLVKLLSGPTEAGEGRAT